MADNEQTEVEKVPMGYVYKYITVPSEEEGKVVTKRIKYYPYTRTRAVFDDDGIDLETRLIALKNWTGYSLTEDITWTEPGVYALDASVGGQYYKLCQQVFQSADDARTRICNAIGLTYNQNTSTSDIISKYYAKANAIRDILNKSGGDCPLNPTMEQIKNSINNAIKHTIDSIDKSVYHKFNFTIELSYNEIKQRFKRGSGSSVHYDIYISGNELKSIIGNVYGKKIAWARIIFPTRFGYGSNKNSNIYYDQYREIFYSHEFNKNSGYHVMDGGNQYDHVNSYTEVTNNNTGKTSYIFGDHHNHYALKYTDSSGTKINCDAYYSLQFDGYSLQFRISSFLDEYMKGEFYDMGWSKEDKNYWKNDKNYYFNIIGHYIE